MSRKKPSGGRVTPKGTQAPATTPAKRSATERSGFPGRPAADPFTAKGQRSGGPAGPPRSGHRRGNR